MHSKALAFPLKIVAVRLTENYTVQDRKYNDLFKTLQIKQRHNGVRYYIYDYITCGDGQASLDGNINVR